MKTLVLEDVDIKLFRRIRNDAEDRELTTEQRHYELVSSMLNGTRHRSLIDALRADPLIEPEQEREWDEIIANIRR
ncbi:hypothetical protein [Cupriavidus pampae]|uniref:Uncharacterized protein n=1 Tax=Cupriavidus pampae TaxID=659251 RepID=A0ABM8WUG5_9BURK|nr:hypothetical protein [Cupriavidus pampae]CAG9171134.1 hypothetical protein LMG32289_02260 [Cupriavidus pampae]